MTTIGRVICFYGVASEAWCPILELPHFSFHLLIQKTTYMCFCLCPPPPRPPTHHALSMPLVQHKYTCVRAHTHTYTHVRACEHTHTYTNKEREILCSVAFMSAALRCYTQVCAHAVCSCASLMCYIHAVRSCASRLCCANVLVLKCCTHVLCSYAELSCCSPVLHYCAMLTCCTHVLCTLASLMC